MAAREHVGARPPRLWTRDFSIPLAVNALVMTVFYLLMTTMAVYAAEQFDASASLAGLASSMFIIGAVVARPAAGPLVDTAGPRRILLGSLLAFVAMSLAYLPAGNLALVLAVRFCHGLAFGLASTAAATAAQSAIPPLRRGEGTGYFMIGVPLAAGVGPLLALHLIERSGYTALFVASGAASAIASLIALLLPPSAPATGTAADRAGGGPTHALGWRQAVHPDVLPLASFMLLIGVASASVLTYVHPYTTASDMAGAADTFFLVYSVVVLLTRLASGRLQDRRGDNTVMYPAIASFAGGLLMLSQADSALGMAASGALVGAGFGSIMPTVQAAAVRLANRERVGVAVSTFYLFLDIGTGLGPLLLGLLITGSGYRMMYLLVALLVLASSAYYHAVHGRREAAR